MLKPYQPFLLRVLHGITGLCLILAIFTALWTYAVYDGRWLKIPFPNHKEIEGIHGTFGLYTLLIFPAFVRYAFQQGKKRLVQSDSLAKLKQFGKPIWWYTLNRLANTLLLLSLTFALFSGKMMDTTWLPKGELDHRWYYAHLISWVVMVVAIALHLLINARVGGTALLLSMWDRKIRDKDSPRLWRGHVIAWWSTVRQSSWATRLSKLVQLPPLELVIWVSIIAAWGISLIKEYGQ